MLSQKPWKPEAMTYFIGALLICLGLGSLAARLVLDTEWMRQFGGEEFNNVLISVFFLQIPIFLVVAWFVHFNGTTWRQAFGFRLKGWQRLAVMAVGTTVLGLALSVALSQLSFFFMESVNLVPREQETVLALKSAVSIYQKLLFGLVAILIAPVVEELLFRGILYPSIKQLGYKRTALWGTSILFGVIHQNVLTAISLTMLSVLLILLYEETDNLLAPIFAHSMFNTANFLWLIFSG